MAKKVAKKPSKTASSGNMMPGKMMMNMMAMEKMEKCKKSRKGGK